MAEKEMGKGHAPSIWSFDSGYASHAGLDNQTDLDGDLMLDGFCIDAEPDIRSPNPIPAAHSVEPKLHVYTNLDPNTSSSSNAFLLPDIHNGLDVGGCLQCAFWDITNPGENLRCEECRLVPDIAVQVVEPGQLLVNGYKSKEIVDLTSLDIRRKETRVSTRCSACEFARLINPTQKGTCGSCADKPKPNSPSSPNPSLLSPISPRSPSSPFGKVRRSRAGRSSKLPLSALTQLQRWLDAHQDNPYPTAEDKRQLALDCGITEKQVTTWFTNARARQLNPLERWASSGSGSEDDGEGVREEDIQRAAGVVGIGNMSGLGLGSGLAESGFTYLPSNGPSSQMTTPYRRAASVSGSSAFSGGPGRVVGGAAPSRRGKKKDYRRSNAPQSPLNEFGSLSPISPISPIGEQQQTPHPTPLQPESTNRPPLQPDQETWQCTFCLRHLVPKSWRRHEETQHRPRSQWTCMLYGPRLSFPSRSNTNPSATSSRANENRNSTSYCAFCMLPSPPESHFQLHHRISECAKRAPKDRTYFRPDHLRQHVKNFHNSKLADSAQARWKNTTSKSGEGDGDEEKGWICGFCGDHLGTWDKRETHIANHFKDGWTMARWREWPQSQSDPETQATGTAAQTQPNPHEDRGKRSQKEMSQSPESSFTKRLSRTLSFGRKSLSLSRSSQPSYTPRASYDRDVNMTGTGAGASTFPAMGPQCFIPNSHNHTTATQNTYLTTPLLTTNINTEPLWSECDFNNLNMNINMNTTNLWDLQTPGPTSSQNQNQQYMPLTAVSSGDLNMDLGVGIYEQDLGLPEGFDLADWKTGNLGNRVDYQGLWK